MTDLKELLRATAAEAENVSVDGSALLPHIRRRRRIRSAAIGAGSVAAVTTLAVGAYAVLPGAAPADAPVSGGPASTLPTFDPKDCKVVQVTHPRAAHQKTELTQQTMRKVGELTWSGTVKVTVTNTSKVTLYTTNTPAAFLISPEQRFESQAGSVQTSAQKNVVLAPGASHTSTVAVTVRGCASWKQPTGSFSVYRPTTGGPQRVGRLQLK